KSGSGLRRKAVSSKQLRVAGLLDLRRHAEVVTREGDALRLAAHRPRARRVVDELLERRDYRIDVVFLQQTAGDAILHDLAVPVHVVADHRAAGRARFDEAEAA